MYVRDRETTKGANEVIKDKKLLRDKSLLEHFTEEIAFGIGEDKSAKEIATSLIATIDQWLPPYIKVDKSIKI